MERRRVVTSFLEFQGRILILKRSDKVRTMKGMWAGISGYLEEDEEPLNRALDEIREEVGVSREDVELIRRSEPVEAPDILQTDLVWVVHPFLFRVKALNIRLDWEHDEYRWIKPEEIDSYKAVPKLKEVLERVV